MIKITPIIIIFSALNVYADFRSELREKLTAGHFALEYSEAKIHLVNTVDNYDGVVCSAYTPSQCKNYNHVDAKNNPNQKGFKLNTEHTWPRSKGAKHAPMESDMHHLYTVSKESNRLRENFPFCEVKYVDWEKEGSRLGMGGSTLEDCFEPTDSHKGNVARAYFYFSVRYGMKVNDEEEKLLRKWHTQDPVDQREIQRNQDIKAIQGNENLFITYPELVDQITDF